MSENRRAAVWQSPAVMIDSSGQILAIGIAPAAITATAGGTLFAWTCFVDRQCAAFPILAIQGQDGGIGPFLRVHGNEGKATGPSGHFVHDDIDLVYRAML